MLEKINKNNAITNFIILECLAVLGFGLGGVNAIFYALAIIISLFALFIASKNFSKEESKTLLLYGLIVFAFSALYSFGALFREDGKVLENILLMLSINGALFLGIASRKIKSITPNMVLITIGVSIALLVLISMIATWSQYGLFYKQIYASHPAYYYGGVRYNLIEETIVLNGFKFSESTSSYYCFFGFICCCFLPGCLFINPKEKPSIFFTYLGVGLIGFASIFTLLSVKALLFLIPILLLTIFYKFFRKNRLFAKILKYFLIVCGSFLAVFFIFVIINAAGNNAFSSLCESNGILNYLFNKNGVVSNVNKVLNYIITNGDFFGISLAGKNIYQAEEILKIVFTNTRMFEIEVIKEAGFIPFILLLTFIVLETIMLFKYVKHSDDNDSSKIIFLSLVVGIFLYWSLSSTIIPFPRTEQYAGILRGPISLIVLFIAGYTMITSNKQIKSVEIKKETFNSGAIEEISL